MTRFYAFAKTLCAGWFKIAGIRVIGAENIPAQQPIIVIANHLSFGDPPALVLTFPYQLTFVAKEEFSHHAFTRILFGALGAVFLKKEESDLTAMRTVINTLKAGHSAAVFPEGRRTFKEGMTEFKPGAAYLAARTGVVVVPVALINTADFLKFWKRNVMINIGMPIFPDQTKIPLSEQVPLLTQRFTEAVTSLHSEIAAILKKEGK